MKTLTVVTLAATIAGMGLAQEKEPRPSPGDRFRFLYMAVFEGLVEEGVQRETVEKVLDPDKVWFITKCPICDAVRFAFQVYQASWSVQSWVRGDLPPGHGTGLSKEEAAKFASKDVVIRHGALKDLINRCVERRFSRLKMAKEEKDRLRESIKIGMKEGLEQLKAQERDVDFPSSCPSCEGAN